METELASRNAHPAYSDEIDLVELFHNLWQQRLLIIVITVVVTASAAAFAFLSTPEYEAKAGVLPPKLSDVAGYNLGLSEINHDQFDVLTVYEAFRTNLLSDSLRDSFLRETSLPALSVIKVSASDVKNRPDFYEVVVKYKSPELAAEWANHYIDMAAKKTEQDMLENIRSEITAKTRVIELQMDVLRSTAKKQREDRIAQLQNALKMAEAAVLDVPQSVLDETSLGGVVPSIDENLVYRRSAKAIRTELTVLKERENDDPYINELRGLESQLDFLKKIEVNPDSVSVFRLDRRAVVPKTPVKPKKAIILVFGIIVGGMLGLFAALIRTILASREVKGG
ncbi:MAG: Wzz/FepE/Etk N-terminal domain-containing protein [Porticoccaceae bacterium]